MSACKHEINNFFFTFSGIFEENYDDVDMIAEQVKEMNKGFVGGEESYDDVDMIAEQVKEMNKDFVGGEESYDDLDTVAEKVQSQLRNGMLYCVKVAVFWESCNLIGGWNAMISLLQPLRMIGDQDCMECANLMSFDLSFFGAVCSILEQQYCCAMKKWEK